IYWYSGSTGSMVNGAEYHVNDDWLFYSGANVQFTNGIVYFEGPESSSLYSHDSDCRLYHIRPYKTGTTLTLQGQDTLYVDGSLIMGSTCTLTTSATMPLLVVNHYINNASTGQIHLDHGELRLTGPSYTNTFQAGDYVNHFSIGEPGSKSTTYTKTLDSDLLVKGNLTINAGTLNPNNYALYVQGNWANYAGTAGFTEGAGLVEFTGGSPAAMLTAETFYNLNLNKTYVGYTGLEISDSVTVLNALNINDGTIKMNNPSVLNVRGDLNIQLNAGLNANDGSGISIYVGDDFDDFNPTSSTVAGYNPGTSTLIMNGSVNQYIRSLTTLNHLEVRSKGNFVYPYIGYELTCEDLNIMEGTFGLNSTRVNVAGNCNNYGNLRMNTANDTLDVNGSIKWFSGSTDDVTSGGIIVRLQWYFYLGANVQLGTGNTVFMRSPPSYGIAIISEYGNNCSFGKLAIDQAGMGSSYIYGSQDTIRVSGDLSLAPYNRIRMDNIKWRVKGTILMSPTSKFNQFLSSAKLEIDGNFTQEGEIEMNEGTTLVHGAYELATTGVLRLHGGEFINDQAYSASKAWRYLRGKMVMDDGLFELTGNSIWIGSTFTDSISGGTLRNGYSFSAITANTFEPSGGVFELSSGTYSTSRRIEINASNYFHDLIFDNTQSTILFDPIDI
ncbi:MAG: hypothetical protein IH599_05075, partial [Bacteroidales bacterium]|nr:hypothetical protein [Bacteroidales bacterium]